MFLHRFLPRKFKNRYYFLFRKAFPLMQERFLVLRCELSAILRQFLSSADTLGVFKFSSTSTCLKEQNDLIHHIAQQCAGSLTLRDTNWLKECFYRWGQRSCGPLHSELVVIPNRPFCEKLSVQFSKVSNFGKDLQRAAWRRTAVSSSGQHLSLSFSTLSRIFFSS